MLKFILISLGFSFQLFSQYQGTRLESWMNECGSKGGQITYEESKLENGMQCYKSVSCKGSGSDFNIDLLQKLNNYCISQADQLKAIEQYKNNSKGGNPDVYSYKTDCPPQRDANGNLIPGNCGHHITDIDGSYAISNRCSRKCKKYYKKGKLTKRCSKCLFGKDASKCIRKHGAQSCLRGNFEIVPGRPSRIVTSHGDINCAHGDSKCFREEWARRRYDTEFDEDCPDCGRRGGRRGRRGGGRRGMNFGETLVGLAATLGGPIFGYLTNKQYAKACPTAYGHYTNSVNELNKGIYAENLQRLTDGELARDFVTPKTPKCNGAGFGNYAGLGGGFGGGLYGPGFYGGQLGLGGFNPYGGLGGMVHLGGNLGFPGGFNGNYGWQTGAPYQPGFPGWQAGVNGHLPYGGFGTPGFNGGIYGGAFGGSIGGAFGGGFGTYAGYGGSFGGGFGNGFGARGGFGGGGFGNGFGARGGFGGQFGGIGNSYTGFAARGVAGPRGGGRGRFANPQATFNQFQRQQQALGRDAFSYGNRWGQGYGASPYSPWNF